MTFVAERGAAEAGETSEVVATSAATTAEKELGTVDLHRLEQEAWLSAGTLARPPQTAWSHDPGAGFADDIPSSVMFAYDHIVARSTDIEFAAESVDTEAIEERFVGMDCGGTFDHNFHMTQNNENWEDIVDIPSSDSQSTVEASFQAVAAVGIPRAVDMQTVAVSLDYYSAAYFLDIRRLRSILANCSVAFPSSTCFPECSGTVYIALKVDGTACAADTKALCSVREVLPSWDCTRDVLDGTYSVAAAVVVDPCD